MAKVKSIVERIEEGSLDEEVGDIMAACVARFSLLRKEHMAKLHRETGQHP